ncbi:zinc-dependent metalloprotease [Serinibacter arcticus]|uniref:Putative hydrolase n=1 Tax=Serinibacter arcticus TaxID=1655435 RepID=A0A4Z1E5C0_9MICO|nr:zinc-dependent metalloprotease [Serinibacter arcticus]TGO06490.1 putative hydrolase [Serinibacter arcticus]
MTQAIDWDAAVARAASVGRAGPPIDRQGLLALVASLRQAAADAPAYVADVTGLHEAAEIAADQPALIVDRPRWAEAATETFASLTDGLLPVSRMPGAARLAGEQLGWVLALLGTRVLGQFDPYVSPEPGRGRLLVVAPNVLSVQRQLDADAQDFHLWVCLHEQTHAVQFAAAPWLADHLKTALAQVIGSEDDTKDGDGEESDDGGTVSLLTRLRRTLRRGDGEGESDGDPDVGPDPEVPADAETPPDAAAGPGVLDAVLEPEQRAALTEAVAVMSLLEGHADVVMDEVGPSAIPTVKQIRAGFEKRRDERTLTALLMRRLLGMDAKLAQYRNGAVFVRGVREKVGHSGLNAVFAGPENLPTAAEIADPDAWVARVHG